MCRPLAERAARIEAEALAARATSVNSSAIAMIARLKLEIEKLRRELFGARSERKARLLDQLEMELEDLEANVTEDELAAEAVAIQRQTVRSSGAGYRRASRSPNICRTSASSSPRRRIVPVADRQSCRSSARTSP